MLLASLALLALLILPRPHSGSGVQGTRAATAFHTATLLLHSLTRSPLLRTHHRLSHRSTLHPRACLPAQLRATQHEASPQREARAAPPPEGRAGPSPATESAPHSRSSKPAAPDPACWKRKSSTSWRSKRPPQTPHPQPHSQTTRVSIVTLFQT